MLQESFIHSFIIIHSSSKYYVNFQYIPGSLPGAENFTVNKANRIATFPEFTV